MHSAWMMLEMIRWGHLHPEADVTGIAGRCVHALPYRHAAASLQIPCPEEDFAPLPLRNGRKLTREGLRDAAAERFMRFKPRVVTAATLTAQRKSWAAERSSG
jgi:hypothetical protein